MKKILLTIFTLGLTQPLLADQYPGDDEFTEIVQRVYTQISTDQIDMEFRDSIQSRNDLCSNLVTRHNSHRAPGASRSNASYIGVYLTQLDCLNALWFSDGYDSSAGWNAWAGNLVGTWFNDDNRQFTDPANWARSVNERGGDGRTYQLQNVLFSSRSGNARFGWNMSHRDVAYVWGWDPKDNTDNNGETGAHVGFTFEKSGAQCIIWATPEEAFLECVKPVNSCGGSRRTSTGFFGMGQWTIGRTSCSTGTPTWGGRPAPIFQAPLLEDFR